MKTQKLIPLLDYVLEVINSDIPCNRGKMLDDIGNYAKFLSQPLKLSMFVVCDEQENILTKNTMSENTCDDDCNHKNCIDEMNICIAYNKAKSNVLFESFYDCGDFFECIVDNSETFRVSKELIEDFKERTIESLAKYGLTLTENAVKTING